MACACAALACLLTSGCSRPREDRRHRLGIDPRSAYAKVLALYPEDRQGFGREPTFPGLAHQPMTYALVASAESLRHARTHDDESGRRVRKAVRWLIDNQDLNHDGFPGWGLPDPWDAFSDGTVNPANHPYTITNAFVLNGLLDALALPGFWTDRERDEIRALSAAVVLRWCRQYWSDGFTGGYLWYSPTPTDQRYVVNVSSMSLGSLSRLLREPGLFLSALDRRFAENRADDLARAIVATARLRHGAPFWDYQPGIDRPGRGRPNDLLHHVYTLWGIETYRDCGGRVKPPWTRAMAIESVDGFWRNGRLSEFPQTAAATATQRRRLERPARLWGAGAMLAFCARWGDAGRARRILDEIDAAYGPIPRLRLRPTASPEDEVFYPRYGAHVLWGLAELAYP